MVLQTKIDFEEFIQRPENQERLFELIRGEIVEKVPSNPYVSDIAGLIIFFLRLFLREQSIAGHVTEGQGGYRVSGEQYAPDVAYLSKARQPELARKGYNPNPPELAVEIEAPTTAESERLLRAKLSNYLAAGVLVWIIYPELKEVELHTPGQPMQLVDVDGVLDGGNVLPGFTLPVKDLFAD